MSYKIEDRYFYKTCYHLLYTDKGIFIIQIDDQYEELTNLYGIYNCANKDCIINLVYNENEYVKLDIDNNTKKEIKIIQNIILEVS